MAPVQEAFFSDTVLVGLASRLSATSLCSLLNLSFGIRFVRQPDLDKSIVKADSGTYYFPGYEYCLPLSDERYILYRLKSREEYLLPELKQLDFIWMVQGGNAARTAQELVQHLRGMPDIQLAQILDTGKLKNRNFLIV